MLDDCMVSFEFSYLFDLQELFLCCSCSPLENMKMNGVQVLLG